MTTMEQLAIWDTGGGIDSKAAEPIEVCVKRWHPEG